MASITVINKTNTQINTTCTYDGVNSSVHNGFNPGEFYVHSAGGIYTLNARYFIGPESMYHENWERIGEILGEVLLDLLAVGLSVVGVGEIIAAGTAAAQAAPAIWAAANTMQRATLVLLQTSLSAFATEAAAAALDLTAFGMGINRIVVKELPADKDWTNISGYQDRVFVVKGGQTIERDASDPTTGTAKYEPLEIEEITQDAFKTMKRDREIYELSRFGHAIFVDSDGARFYTDEAGRKIYSPDSDEYYIGAGGTHVSVDSNDQRENPYRLTTVKPGLTGNTSGQWTPGVYTLPKDTFAVPIEGFEVRNQRGHGVINVRALYDTDKKTAWVRDEMGNSSAFSYQGRAVGGRISKVDVREEEGYGIIDMRVHTEGEAKDPSWMVQNEFKENKKHDYSFNVPPNMILVGILGKEQGTFGLVDVKLVLADKP